MVDSFDDHSNTLCTNGCFCSRGEDPTIQRPMLDSASLSTDDTNMKEARKLVLQDMNHLSVKEREQVYEDVHGVRQEVEDKDDRIAYVLNQMEVEINKIKSKCAYLLAVQMSKEVIQDIKFRLQFLRSTCFDPILAANRFVKFFEMKFELFGQEKLIKKIMLSDLNENDQHCLMSGRFQLLPQRDRSGRAVIHFIYAKSTIQHVDSMLRALWYFLMSVFEDEETQRTGIVGVYNLHGSDENHDRKLDPSRLQLFRRASHFSKCLPMRVSCTHYCFHGSKIMAIMSVLVKGVESIHRTRMCFHDGSDSECQFSLMTYGIPIHALPVTTKGKIIVDTHTKWIQSRKILECTRIRMMMMISYDNRVSSSSMNCNTIPIYLPSKYDVLCERGKPYQNYTGNERLRQMIIEYEEKCPTVVKGEKSVLASIIMQQYKECFGRFLKKDKNNNNLWMEVSNDIATKKVNNMFRTLVVTSNNNESCGVNSSISSSISSSRSSTNRLDRKKKMKISLK